MTTARAWSGELVRDGYDVYEIQQTIGQGSSCTVYAARCVRGRLHGRDVALKKMDAFGSSRKKRSTHLHDSTSLHRSLHHPAILSLYAMMSTPDVTYHVLELCPRGTLADYIRSRRDGRMTESQTRGVIRTLVDALMYLRKELIVHRDIKASNVLISANGRVKLADFGLAERLSSPKAASTTFCGSPNYVAPEIVKRTPYSFPVDIWSLGCLTLTCLSGTPPFEADSLSDVFANVQQAAYDMPQGVSPEAADLIDGLLQLDPDDRTRLHLISSRPFFDPSLRSQALDDGHAGEAYDRSHTMPLGDRRYQRKLDVRSRLPANDAADHHPPDLVSKQKVRRKTGNDLPLPPHSDTLEAQRRVVSDPEPRRFPFQPKTVRVSSLASDFAMLDIRPRPILGRGTVAPMTKEVDPHCDEDSPEDPLSLRTALDLYRTTASRRPSPEPGRGNRERSRSPTRSHRGEPSAPTLPVGEHFLKLEARLRRLHSDEDNRRLPTHLSVNPVRKHPLRPQNPDHELEDERLLHPPSKPAHVAIRGPPARRTQDLLPLKSSLKQPRVHPSTAIRSLPLPSLSGDNEAHDVGNMSAATALTTMTLPIGTTRPRPLPSAPLKPQTYRVAHGALQILPSHELLIDFRAGERARGKHANAVLVVSEDGTTVRIYRGVHEPALDTLDLDLGSQDGLYTAEALPRRYWKTWNDAEKLVEHLKQRSPKMILHEAHVRWTLMANEPHGDVEGLFFCARAEVGRSSAQELRGRPRADRPSMRVRLSRKRNQMEVARVVRSNGGPGEWVVKKLAIGKGDGGWTLVGHEEPGSEEEERGVAESFAFVRLCESLEDGGGRCVRIG